MHAKAVVAALIEAESQNKSWGFYGTVSSNYEFGRREAQKVWDCAHGLAKKYADDPVEFLDSTAGRHLADELTFTADTQSDAEAVCAAVKKLDADGILQKRIGQWQKRHSVPFAGMHPANRERLVAKTMRSNKSY